MLPRMNGLGARHRDHPCPEIAVACGVLSMAIKDMRDREAKHIRARIDATVWLATKAATLWFDAAGVGQGYALDGMGWISHAADLLGSEESFMAITAGQGQLLRDGMDHSDMTRRV
jgi:hypothetical protein